ncbi:MAG TPA: class II aldolase/adducin family protein, partial [Stellaceae bacterium]
MHKDRPEALSIAHLHARASTLMGIAGRDIEPVYSQGGTVAGGVPTWDDPRMVLDDTAAVALSKALGKHVACQMRGQGSVVVGETAEACLQTCLFMEENAQYQIDAELLGGYKPFPKEIWDGLAAQRRGGWSAQLVWNYWLQFVEEEGISALARPAVKAPAGRSRAGYPSAARPPPTRRAYRAAAIPRRHAAGNPWGWAPGPC